jgi:hypothetical protein
MGGVVKANCLQAHEQHGGGPNIILATREHLKGASINRFSDWLVLQQFYAC